MGAADTMEIFFERLNAGDREGAVKLMDERAEMRVHVRDSSRTLRGVSQVGGWFLRADEGLRMVPGDVREMGNTYEADLLVLRPGAPSQHLDATFRVEAGLITSINLSPQVAAASRPHGLAAPPTARRAPRRSRRWARLALAASGRLGRSAWRRGVARRQPGAQA